MEQGEQEHESKGTLFRVPCIGSSSSVPLPFFSGYGTYSTGLGYISQQRVGAGANSNDNKQLGLSDLFMFHLVLCTVKKEKKIFVYTRKFRRDRVQSKVIYEEGLPNIRGTAQIFSHI